MKKILSLFLTVAGLVWSCSTSDPQKTTLLYLYTPYHNAPEYLHGQVKTVKERAYWAVDNNGSIEKGELVTTKEKEELRFSLDFDAHFDKDGNIVHRKYILDDKKYNSFDIEYHDGKIGKATYTRNDTVRSYGMVEYLNDDMTISIYSFPENELIRSVIRKLNETGIATKVEFFNSKNEQQGYTLYELNDQNRVVGYKRYNTKDSLLFYAVYTYDDRGFGNTTKAYDGNGNINWDGVYENLSYDEYGNWTTSKAMNDGKLTLFFEREYEYY